MENLIEELTKVNPANLSEEGLKLFNKINEIIDRNEELEKQNKYLYQKLKAKQHLSFEDGAICERYKIEKDYIPKSKVKEKIENKKKALKNNELEFDEICEIEHSIREFQELLQEGDK